LSFLAFSSIAAVSAKILFRLLDVRFFDLKPAALKKLFAKDNLCFSLLICVILGIITAVFAFAKAPVFALAGKD